MKPVSEAKLEACTTWQNAHENQNRGQNGAQQPSTSQYNQKHCNNQPGTDTSQGGRPAPSFIVITWSFQETTNLGHLGLEKSLQVLLLGFNVASQFTSLHLQLTLD